jgi:hypothetical protein
MRLPLFAVALMAIGQTVVAQGVPDKAEKLLDRTVKALVDEAERLARSGKEKDVEVVAAIVKDLEQEVLRRQGSPDAIKLRQALFAKRLLGRWKRITFPDSYEFFPDGTVSAITATGEQTSRGKFQRFLSDSSAEYKWNTGHIWHVHYSGVVLLRCWRRSQTRETQMGSCLSESSSCDQFTPGCRTTRLVRPPLAPSDRAYTPARSADRHRPEAHCRRLSILSPAVTATGTTFFAA